MARILVGVSGGIAAYKAVELVRLATGAGHAVRVVQTPASLQFVGRATFEGVTGAPVLVDEFERDPARGAYPGEPAPSHDPISHLELVRRADLFCVAPASANTLAKLAHGLADNLLTSAALACTAPLVLAPAMNNHMYEHGATQANLGLLRGRGATVVEPETGPLASRGEWGVGRLAQPARILETIEGLLGRAGGPMDGLRVLVTAGGTREAVDSVRFVGNRASGRMGVALAEEARRRGADVILLAANLAVDVPHGVEVIPTPTAQALLDAATALEDVDLVLMAAAVADYRPAEALATKRAKSDEPWAIELQPTVDVARTLGERKRDGQVLVAFGAEHGEEGLERKRRMLETKNADLVVYNDVSRTDIGFDSDDNEVVLVTRDGERRVPKAAKAQIAAAILDEAERFLR